MHQQLLGLAAVIALAACGGPEETTTTAAQPTADDGVLLDRQGRLEEGDQQMPSGLADHYEVAVHAGDRITVQLTSAAFDPLLEVTPPASARVVNDDWQGDRQRSRVDFIAAADGTVKIRVTTYAAGATGDYRVRVDRIPPVTGPATLANAAQAVAVLSPGQPMGGELAQGDSVLTDGAFYDQLAVDVPQGQAYLFAVSAAEGPAPRVDVVDPEGRALAPSREGPFLLSQPGPHRIVVAAPAPGARVRYAAELRSSTPATPQLARTHHQPPGHVPSTPVQVGQHVRGALEPADGRLPTGETADVYTVTGSAGAPLTVEMSSSEIDSYVLVVGPDGQLWEDDDGGGGRNALLELSLPRNGEYRIVATSYQAGTHGQYELKVRSARETPAEPAQVSAAAHQQGDLASGDSQLQSGEYFDRYTFDLVAGQRATFRATSTAFDTYLIVRTPAGRQEDNDDAAPGNTNAQVELAVTETGPHVVMVTSYQPGEAGPYTLDVTGAGAPAGQGGGEPAPPAPPPVAGRDVRGTLAQGDTALASGEFTDRQTLRFEPGRPVRLRLRSAAFDPYLIVRTPSGEQIDNDDYVSGDLTAGVDIPSAETGEYTVIVTSYRPGETGAWTLSTEAADSVAAPPVANAPGPSPGPAAPQPGGGRVFGVFAGITDYPAGVNDLDECANDAVKLAQTLREHGLLSEDRQIVLTDGHATRDGLRSALRSMAQRVRPDDVFVFFYSGHGGRAEGRPTRDTREIDGADEYLYLYDGELLDDELGSLMDGIGARVAVVALDACFAGGFAKDVITRPGRIGLFSSEEDVTSAVAAAFHAGGYLSHFLRLGVSGEADAAPRDGMLTVGELTHYLTLQFGSYVRDVRTSEGFQHLVVDRGAVRATDVMWAYR